MTTPKKQEEEVNPDAAMTEALVVAEVESQNLKKSEVAEAKVYEHYPYIPSHPLSPADVAWLKENLSPNRYSDYESVINERAKDYKKNVPFIVLGQASELTQPKPAPEVEG